MVIRSWENSCKNGNEYLRQKKYCEAERELCSALTYAYRMRQIREFELESCDDCQTAVRRHRRDLYQDSLARVQKKIIEACKLDDKVAQTQALKEYQKVKELAELPDTRINGTKQLLSYCYKEHAASLRTSMLPVNFVSKDVWLGLSIASALIALFSFVGQNILFGNRSSAVILVRIAITVIFAFAYFAFDKLASNISDIERCEKAAADLRQ